MSVEGIYKGITRAKKEGNSIEGTGGQKRGQTRNCNLPSGNYNNGDEDNDDDDDNDDSDDDDDNNGDDNDINDDDDDIHFQQVEVSSPRKMLHSLQTG